VPEQIRNQTNFESKLFEKGRGVGFLFVPDAYNSTAKIIFLLFPPVDGLQNAPNFWSGSIAENWGRLQLAECAEGRGGWGISGNTRSEEGEES
jgi:hypothetical protein